MYKFIIVLVFGVVLLACGDDPALNGEACEKDEDCESELCFTEAFGGAVTYPDGMCSAECAWDREPEDDLKSQGTCMEGETCLKYTLSGEQFCHMNCGPNDDYSCREEYTCMCVGFCNGPVEKGIYVCLPPL